MSELQKFMDELRKMQQQGKNILNTREIWSFISNREWEKAGFSSEDEAKQWIADNPYANLG